MVTYAVTKVKIVMSDICGEFCCKNEYYTLFIVMIVSLLWSYRPEVEILALTKEVLLYKFKFY